VNPGASLDRRQQLVLLDRARSAIAARFTGAHPPPPESEGEPLGENRGAFVTLTIGGALRGCIGHVIGVVPLWQAVEENAVAAAFSDPRFPPLTSEELDQARIEISVLSPLRRVSPETVVVGRDGVLVASGASRGLLLPQVATEYGWDRETLLDHACRKAGLEPTAWSHPDTRIWTFTAEVFGEEEPVILNS
jgi:AmmeMemoRadiSam system protein A